MKYPPLVAFCGLLFMFCLPPHTLADTPKPRLKVSEAGGEFTVVDADGQPIRNGDITLEFTPDDADSRKTPFCTPRRLRVTTGPYGRFRLRLDKTELTGFGRPDLEEMDLDDQFESGTGVVAGYSGQGASILLPHIPYVATSSSSGTLRVYGKDGSTIGIARVDGGKTQVLDGLLPAKPPPDAGTTPADSSESTPPAAVDEPGCLKAFGVPNNCSPQVTAGIRETIKVKEQALEEGEAELEKLKNQRRDETVPSVRDYLTNQIIQMLDSLDQIQSEIEVLRSKVEGVADFCDPPDNTPVQTGGFFSQDFAASGNVIGYVTDTVGGRMTDGVTVTVTGPGLEDVPVPVGEDGSYSLHSVQTGLYKVTIKRDGYHSVTRALEVKTGRLHVLPSTLFEKVSIKDIRPLPRGAQSSGAQSGSNAAVLESLGRHLRCDPQVETAEKVAGLDADIEGIEESIADYEDKLARERVRLAAEPDEQMQGHIEVEIRALERSIRSSSNDLWRLQRSRKQLVATSCPPPGAADCTGVRFAAYDSLAVRPTLLCNGLPPLAGAQGHTCMDSSQMQGLKQDNFTYMLLAPGFASLAPTSAGAVVGAMAGAGGLQIEGHTDERGTREYHLALGERRSQSALKYLQAQRPLDQSRDIRGSVGSMVSYGEHRVTHNSESLRSLISENHRLQGAKVTSRNGSTTLTVDAAGGADLDAIQQSVAGQNGHCRRDTTYRIGIGAGAVNGQTMRVVGIDAAEKIDFPALLQALRAIAGNIGLGRWIALQASPGSAARDAPTVATEYPNDGFLHSTGSWGQPYADQWGLHRIGFKPGPRAQAHPLWTRPGEPVVVAVVDSGVDITHAELQGAIWANWDDALTNDVDDDGNGYTNDFIGWNFVDDSNNTLDDNGHGTFVAGIIAARTDNARGMAGVNPSAYILPVKVADFAGHSNSFDVAQGIAYAARRGARVINVSLAGRDLTLEEQAAVDEAAAAGALVVVAAGNEAVDTSGISPAGLAGVITVAATDHKDKRTDYSNWGGGVDIAAPGSDILSLRAIQTDLMQFTETGYEPGSQIMGDDREYYRLTGTSFAAPHVAGVASLLMSLRPELSAAQVKRMLLQSAIDIAEPGVDMLTGYGLLDAAAALAADPEFYVDAAIASAGVVAEGSDYYLQVLGTSSASRFKEATIEVGQGSEPEQWQRVGRLRSAVEDGELTKIPAATFSAGKQWTLRLITTHRNGRTREARLSLDMG